jgi:hypothetical protein
MYTGQAPQAINMPNDSMLLRHAKANGLTTAGSPLANRVFMHDSVASGGPLY